MITPEGCAAILWRDAAKASKAAEALKITAPDLEKLGLIDQVLPEPIGGAHRDPLQAAATLKAALLANLDRLGAISEFDRKELRYQKFRQMGVFTES